MNGTSDGYSFSQANYNAGKCGKGHNLTSDIPQSNVTYDTATANMGAPWKMPTVAQCRELIDNTTHTWTTMNGVNGRKFTNKSDSNKYIFLPAGGGWNNTNNYSNGSNGYYWSTGWYSSSYAWQLRFSSGTTSMDTNNRYFGYCVRGIK